VQASAGQKSNKGKTSCQIKLEIKKNQKRRQEMNQINRACMTFYRYGTVLQRKKNLIKLKSWFTS